MSYADKTPYFEEMDKNAQSSAKDKEIRIRVKLSNKGNYTADHCLVNVDCYYEKRAKEDSYCIREFTPISIRDYRNSPPSFVAPNMVYYLDIASIHKTDEMSKADDENKAHQFYKLFLVGDKMPMKLGTGTFIIPIKFYSSKVKSVVSYLKIYWDSTEYTTDKRNFIIEMLTEKEFNDLKKA